MSSDPNMQGVTLSDGTSVPALGQGTWNMAERPERRRDEILALRSGVDVGMTLIDTAEMYASGGAETLVAEALGDRRGDIFLVSKVLPNHATRRGTIAACESSLRRLRTDYLDLYLLHWRESVPLAETFDAFETLQRHGKIRRWGVSNFDVDDLEEAVSLTGDANSITTNQVLYNAMRRGVEFDLLPWCRGRNISIMAYSPLEQGRLLEHRALRAVARRLGVTAAQVALAWVLRQDGVIAIPKAATIDRVRENHAALDLSLGAEELRELDTAFPPPRRRVPLQML